MSSGSGPEFELAGHLELAGVDHVDDVAVAGGDIDLLAVGARDDAARAARGRDGLDDLQRLAVDHRDGVVLLVGDEDLQRPRRGRRRKTSSVATVAVRTGRFISGTFCYA